jgi:hypothetical protein
MMMYVPFLVAVMVKKLLIEVVGAARPIIG